MSNVFREASATGAASGRGILARVAALVAVLAFALLTFADGSYATESELVSAAAPTGKIVEVMIRARWWCSSGIRSQGFGCNQPTTAERDPLASIPDEGVWLLQCEDGSYRVRLIPHMAAKVERVGQ